MANIKKLQFEGKDIYPLTHIDAIVDDSGDFIKNKYVTMTNFEGTNSFTVNPLMPDEIQQVNARLNMVADDIQNNTLGTLIDKVGDLNSLQTSNKSNAVVAINDVISNSESIQNSLVPKLDKSTYDNKITTLTQNLNSVNAATNNVKSRLVNTLISKDISASNTESIDSLIGKVQNVSGGSINVGIPKFIDSTNVFHSHTTTDIPMLQGHIMVECNGLLHIFGGWEGTSLAQGPANYNHYCFDTDLGTVTTISTKERLFNGATAVTYNNLIYVYGTYWVNEAVMGGYGMMVYSPTTNTWTDKIMNENTGDVSPRQYYTMTLGNNNNIYIIGGMLDSSGTMPSNIVFAYNPTNNAITGKTHHGYGIVYHAAAAVGNYIYVFGGSRSNDTEPISRQVARYNVSSDSWSNRTDMPQSLSTLNAVAYNQDIYLFGGYSYDVNYNLNLSYATYCYETTKDSYLINYRGSSSIHTHAYAQAARKDNFIYIVGGTTPDGTNLYAPLSFYIINKDKFATESNLPGGGTTKPLVQPITIMSNKIYSGSTQFKTYGTAVTYSTSSGLTMKPNSATYHVWSALNAPIDVTDYTNVKLTFQCGTAGVHKFMIGASTSIGSNAAGNGTSLPVFNSGTSEVKPTQTFGTSAYYVVNIDISNITGSQYLTVVGCYDTETVYYINGIYITDFVLE